MSLSSIKPLAYTTKYISKAPKIDSKIDMLTLFIESKRMSTFLVKKSINTHIIGAVYVKS